MGEIDDGPGHAGTATEDGEDEEPREEEDQNVEGPDTWVREPLRVPVQIRRRYSLHVQIGHIRSPDVANPILTFVLLIFPGSDDDGDAEFLSAAWFWIWGLGEGEKEAESFDTSHASVIIRIILFYYCYF